MEYTLSVTELVRNFADYVNRVFYRRERFVLTRGNKPVAELRPLPAGRTLAELSQIVASLPPLSVEDATQFADDLDKARQELAQQTSPDPWAS